jgi:DNA invertase Pin-like site-specific DNA recombinase
MRIGIYARVSTTDQDCSQQLRDLREYATARRWEIQGEYVDHAVSGTKESRPAMNRLMEAARRRAVDVIVCWKIDRWGRSMPAFVSSVQELRSLGVRFIAVTQGIDTDESNPTARLMLNLLAAFGEFERELIIERTRAGLQRARREGRIGGRPRLVVSRSKIIQMDSEGMTAREVAHALGISAASVCRILGEAGLSKRKLSRRV